MLKNNVNKCTGTLRFLTEWPSVGSHEADVFQLHNGIEDGSKSCIGWK